MEKILLLTEEFDAHPLQHCSREKELRPFSTQSAFARTLVDETGILAGIFELSPGNERLRGFIISVIKHFPLLSAGIIRKPGAELFYRAIDSENSRSLQWFYDLKNQGTLNNKLCRYINGSFPKNRRAYHRFDWILNGYLDGVSGKVEKYKIRSFSAGGAFLESNGDFPQSKTKGQIRVEFQNFQLLSDCEFLDPRSASSNMPFGFGVRFLNLSSESEGKINTIVKDALFQILIQPENEPDVPSLGEEELTPDFYLFL